MTERFGTFTRRVRCADEKYYRATRGIVVGGMGHLGKGSEHRGASRRVLGACVERLLAGCLLEQLTA